MTTMTTTPTDCEFNAPDADILLLSNEEDEFRVHKCILAAASPFFKHMFTLPQPISTYADLPEDRQLPVIPMSEHTSTLDTLLHYVYPVPDPIITSLDELGFIIGAAVKYDFVGVISSLRKVLISPNFLHDSPTRVFAIASRYDLEFEAKLASQYTLSVNVLDCPLSEDLKYITAYSYHRLLDLHRRRAAAAQRLLKLPEDVKCMQCNGSTYGNFCPPKWWKEFERLAKQELAERPTTDVIFGMAFLAQVIETCGCPRCAASIICSYRFLDALKKQIDELPATI